jgi:hypothetical protein
MLLAIGPWGYTAYRVNVARFILDRLTETAYNEHAQDTKLFKPGSQQ